MTHGPQYLKFLPLARREFIQQKETKGELRLLWLLVSFVLVYLAFIVGKAIW